jgi:hypothetical protein
MVMDPDSMVSDGENQHRFLTTRHRFASFGLRRSNVATAIWFL